MCYLPSPFARPDLRYKVIPCSECDRLVPPRAPAGWAGLPDIIPGVRGPLGLILLVVEGVVADGEGGGGGVSLVEVSAAHARVTVAYHGHPLAMV